MTDTYVEVHGRVNLIGEHTDYNGGFVFPTLIPQKTSVRMSSLKNSMVQVESSLMGTFEYRLGEEKKESHWGDYIKGVTSLLQKNYPIDGVHLKIDSTIPAGSGLSSSAALNVSLMRAFSTHFHFDLTDLEIAKLAQKVENDFVGARVGIMDPLICALGKFGQALFVNTRNLECRQIPLPKKTALIVIHSGITHKLSSQNGYNTRRSECDEACKRYQVNLLSDLKIEDLSKISSPRVHHVITENQRVLDFIKALEKDDLISAGKLMNSSHSSLRDDYEVSIPEIDTLVSLAQNTDGVFGARMTGGGFGGSIVALASAECALKAGQEIIKNYFEKTNHRGTLLVPSFT